MKIKKQPAKAGTVVTQTQQTSDSQMPAILYKGTQNIKTRLWKMVWMGSNFKKSTGFNHDDFSDNRVFWESRLHPEDRDNVVTQMNTFGSGMSNSMEVVYRWLHKDGTYHWFIDNATFLKSSKDAPEVIGSWIDISIYIKAERIIEENEEHYKKIVELSPHALFVYSDGVFRFLNTAAVKLFGGTRLEDLIGKPILDFIPREYHEQIKQQINVIIEKKKPTPLIPYQIITIQGVVKDVEIAATPFTFQDKLSVQGVIVDMTKLKIVEDLYRAKTDELEHLNRLLMKREVDQGTRGEKIYTTSFDSEKSLLFVGSSEVKIKKFSKQYSILQIIFKDVDSIQKDWQFSEISESMDIEAIFDWKKLYNVADAIKKNIAIETGIKDFFILTTQSIKINPLYLENS